MKKVLDFIIEYAILFAIAYFILYLLSLFGLFSYTEYSKFGNHTYTRNYHPIAIGAPIVFMLIKYYIKKYK